ncbi:hypothetical protein [Vagococcus lutrae]|uniref:hypothetical protein n=1 Tax=Vagococcus lutrae TaxID=81947 RepID=UPI00288D3D92|nr:hypothetical protein [Vagococcus lutrae]MDT2842626.1 hypothetical protein [Vagococcus lutrae]
MKLKLVDVETEIYETEFGTCELCMSTGTAYEPTYVFEKENGDTVKVEGFYWDWGDLSTLDVDNVIDFADYVSKKEFEEVTDDEMDYNWLSSLIDEYEKCLKDLT